MRTAELKTENIATLTDRDDLVFVNIDEEPFRVYGVYRDGDCYRRLPREVAEKCNGNVRTYQTATAGGRVRFVTTSKYISVRVVLNGTERADNLTDVTLSGVDAYADGEYIGTAGSRNLFNAETGEKLLGVMESGGGGLGTVGAGVDALYECIINLGDTRGRTVTLNMPVFNGVKTMHIGLQKDAEISHAPDYSLEKPIVFYGSSITHGASASRPGLIYENLLSRELGFNYTDLGFSGGAKAEPAISEYIASLEPSIFVYDYDHNAPSAEYLEETHERMFLEFRAKNPSVPVLMLSRPYGRLDADIKRRQEIISATYERAVARGDKNVYLVLGSEFFPDGVRTEFSVDGCHPNDIGFRFMADAIKPVLSKMISGLK